MFSQACVKNSVQGEGGMHGKEVFVVGGGHVSQRGGMRGRRDSHCSGQYASYWNAFLYLINWGWNPLLVKRAWFIKNFKQFKLERYC